MANPSKAKGTAYESAVRVYLLTRLPYMLIDRNALHGALDTGDIRGLAYPTGPGREVPCVVECKNTPSQPNITRYLKQTRAETRNMGPGSVGVLTTKLPGLGRKHTGEQPAIIPDEYSFIVGRMEVLPFKRGGNGRGTFGQLRTLCRRALKKGCACAWRYPRQPRTSGRLLVVTLRQLCDIIDARHKEFFKRNIFRSETVR